MFFLKEIYIQKVKKKNHDKYIVNLLQGCIYNVALRLCISIHSDALKNSYKPMNIDYLIYYNIIIRYISENDIRVTSRHLYRNPIKNSTP